MRTFLTIGALTFALLMPGAPALSQGKAKATPKSKKKPANPVVQSKNEVVEKTKEYKANLEKEIPFLEERVKEAVADLEKKRALLIVGVVAKAEVDRSEKAVAAAQQSLTSKQSEIAREMSQVDHFLAEAIAAEKISKMPHLRMGGYSVTAGLIRFNGTGGWSLYDVAKVESFFSSRFNRSLPVSAFGQTATHDRMGFDHRNSVDVAVHPDNPEGQAIIAYLRSSGIPFIAFRGAVPGSATGAHIHIGYPSRRIHR